MPATKTRAADLAAALADPLRLDILHRLMEGPATVTDIVASTGHGQSKISNHLAVLRERSLVASWRNGRQVEYRLSGPPVAQIIESLEVLAGGAARVPAPDAPIARARTCYDHLAGRLGVSLLDSLLESGALKPPRGPDGDLRLTPVAGDAFKEIGVDVDRVPRGRRRFAFACLDWTERRPHLGGALGAALCTGAFEAGWVERVDGTRAVRATAKGRAAFRRLGIES